MVKGIYLGAGKANHDSLIHAINRCTDTCDTTVSLVYQDIDGKRDIGGDMVSVQLQDYDFLIATPPCNYWSKARGKRCSSYSLETRYLLPLILYKFVLTGKPFIVENVRNAKRFAEYDIFTYDLDICHGIYCYEVNRHTFFTNVRLKDIDKLPFRQDFRYGGYVLHYDDMKDTYHQGGYNVHLVIDYFIKEVCSHFGINCCANCE